MEMDDLRQQQQHQVDGGNAGTAAAGRATPPLLLLDPGPGVGAHAETAPDQPPEQQQQQQLLKPNQRLPPDLELAAVLLGVRDAGGAPTADSRHNTVTAAAAAALGARRHAVSAALFRALLHSAPDGAAAAAAGSALVLEVGPGPAGPSSRVVARGMRTAVLAHPAANQAATSPQAGHQEPVVLFDFDQPIVALETLQWGNSAKAAAAGAAAAAAPPAECSRADALLIVGARGRVLLLHAAPSRLPPALAPLLRVLHPASAGGSGIGGGLCVNELSAHERQLPLRLAHACLVPWSGTHPARLALLTRRGALYTCDLSPGATTAAGATAPPPLPQRLDVRPVSLPARAAALEVADRPGCIIAGAAADGQRMEVDLRNAVISFAGAEQAAAGARAGGGVVSAAATREEVGGVAAALERLSALRERLRRRGAALEAAYSAAAGELSLLGPQTGSSAGVFCGGGDHRGWGGFAAATGAAPAALPPHAWGGAGALAARLQIEGAWATPAAAARGTAAAPLFHLMVRARLVNTSPHHSLGTGWQLLLQWVPERSEQSGWQAGTALAPLPPCGAAAAALLLPVPPPPWGGALAGGWVQLLLVKPAAGSGDRNGSMDCVTSRGAGGPGLSAVAVLARVRVSALQLSRLVQSSQAGTCLADPAALSAAAALSRYSLPGAAALRRSCLMHLQLRARPPGAAAREAAAKRRRLIGLAGNDDSSNPAGGRDQWGRAVAGQAQHAAEGSMAAGSGPLGHWLRAALGCEATYSSSSGSQWLPGARAAALQVPLVGGGVVEADWGPPPGGPGAPVPGGLEEEAVVLRLSGSNAPALVAARGALVESMAAQLRLRAAAANADAAARAGAVAERALIQHAGGGSSSNGFGREAAVPCEWSLESDRPRLQQALRRLQQLRGRAAQLRAQLGEALRLREALDSAAAGPEAAAAVCGAGAAGAGGCSGDVVKQLLGTAAALGGGVEVAYGHMLLAVTDATRLVLTAAP